MLPIIQLHCDKYTRVVSSSKQSLSSIQATLNGEIGNTGMQHILFTSMTGTIQTALSKLIWVDCASHFDLCVSSYSLLSHTQQEHRKQDCLKHLSSHLTQMKSALPSFSYPEYESEMEWIQAEKERKDMKKPRHEEDSKEGEWVHVLDKLGDIQKQVSVCRTLLRHIIKTIS